MGEIIVHEYIGLDGVYEAPVWTFEYGSDPKMEDSINAMMAASTAILLGRNSFAERTTLPNGGCRSSDRVTGVKVASGVCQLGVSQPDERVYVGTAASADTGSRHCHNRFRHTDDAR